jgi:spore germination cell wall hydrolase CwlJ-like protein
MLMLVIVATINHNRTTTEESEPETETIIETVSIVRQTDSEKVKSVEPTTAEPHKCSWADISLNDEEYHLLCTTVFCEAGNQTVETQTMVALTILNRINSDIFPSTVREVVYQDEQFAVTKWNNFENYGWTESVTAAVKNALADNEYPDDMYYFRTLHYHTFGTPYMQSEDLYFSTEKGEDNGN